MISSERLARVMRGVLKEALWTQTAVSHLTPQSVTLADGQRLMADVVIDGCGWQPAAPFHTESQAFLGQAWRLREPHGMSQPVLMDATVTQHGGYHFVYTLPLSEHTLFIEDTHYINGTVFNFRQARENIACYAAANQWRLMAMEREEQGCLPITLGGCHHQFWQQKAGQPCSGLRANLFHVTTGYSLPQAVTLADLIAARSDWDASHLYSLIYHYACQQWRRQRFFRMLNRLLFQAGPANQRWRIMQRFYQLNDGLIARFYAGNLRLSDKVLILMGNPPVPLIEAIKAIFTRKFVKRIPRL